jgi:hypothetical protein
VSLRLLIRQLRESLGGGSFMGGGASYPGPEPGMIFTRVTYPGYPGNPPEPPPPEKQPPGRERTTDPKSKRRPLKYLGRRKDDDDKGQGHAG